MKPGVRHLCRLLFHAATLLSLLLCIGTLTLWIITHDSGYWYGYRSKALFSLRPLLSRHVVLEAGTASLCESRLQWLDVNAKGVEREFHQDSAQQGWRSCNKDRDDYSEQFSVRLETSRWGFHVSRTYQTIQKNWWGVTSYGSEEFPHTINPDYPGDCIAQWQIDRVNIRLWWPCILTGLLPVMWLARIGLLRVQAVRSRLQQLHICAACGYDLRASHGACPECGKPISAKPSHPSLLSVMPGYRFVGLLSFLSLLLAIAVACLWARNIWWRTDVIDIVQEPICSCQLSSEEGQLSIGYDEMLYRFRTTSRRWDHWEGLPASNPRFNRWPPLVLDYAKSPRYFRFVVQYWFVILLGAVLPLFWVARACIRLRRARN
ncbi:MAG: hypothetical protein NTW19_05645 [Planctomycetota bacterium]|nr:hypothetical protein [Planctomycetota bacterium]